MASHSLDVLGRIRTVVPPALAARAAMWESTAAPATPRRSASVVLIRPSVDAALETYLLHRHARMAFAASMAVFPGGGLDPIDERAADPLRACAVRETYEETGVRLDPGQLLDWAHWITPELEPRRFDTRFYLAVLPSDQTAADLSGETERAGWSEPAAAIAAATRGEIGLMPPTLSILTELAEAGRVETLLEAAADRVVATVQPRLEQHEGEWRFVYPEAMR